MTLRLPLVLSQYKKGSTTPLLPISISIMSWFWTIFFLITLTTINTSSVHQKPSAVVIGTVYCDTCFRFQHNLPKASQFLLAGASVVVQCKGGSGSRTSFRQEVKTDSHGEFKVHLPFPISRRIRRCSVKLISSNKPYCAVAASASSSNLRLKSRKHGTRVFSAGFFTFRPLKQPDVCDQKPTTQVKRVSQISNPSNDPAFIPPVQDPPSFGGSFFLPRLPPLPQLPRLPPLPFLPPKKQPANDAPKLSENQQPAADAFPFPPNPFNLPITLPPILPPLFPSVPNAPPLLNLPPIPGLIPSPPPPPPRPALQLPPFPFQPTPGFPGVPPAVASEKNSP